MAGRTPDPIAPSREPEPMAPPEAWISRTGVLGRKPEPIAPSREPEPMAPPEAWISRTGVLGRKPEPIAPSREPEPMAPPEVWIARTGVFRRKPEPIAPAEWNPPPKLGAPLPAAYAAPELSKINALATMGRAKCAIEAFPPIIVLFIFIRPISLKKQRVSAQHNRGTQLCHVLAY
jgi:DNA polymerase-3 subunit gamma/tau